MVPIHTDKYGNKWIEAKLPIRIHLDKKDPRTEVTEGEAMDEGQMYLMEIAQSNDGSELLANGELEF